MNPQGSKDNSSGGIEWTHIFGPRTGYTANPVRGCEHACRWRMPDGKIAICYAEAFANRLKPGSFQNITWHPEVLDQIRDHNQPAGIFIDSMSDLFGANVPSEHIERVIETMAACPQHIFFTLTKNPRRLPTYQFPHNVIVGMSSPPTFMYGKEMTPETQRAWFRKGIDALVISNAKRVWLSLEPLSNRCGGYYRGVLSAALLGCDWGGFQWCREIPTRPEDFRENLAGAGRNASVLQRQHRPSACGFARRLASGISAYRPAAAEFDLVNRNKRKEICQ